MNNANNVFNFTETISINSMYQTGNSKASTKRRSGIRVAYIHLGIFFAFLCKQGKSGGFDSCDRPSKLTQIRFKLPIFQPVWPWNLMDDLEKLNGISSTLHQALYIISNPSVNSNWSYCPETLNSGQNLWFFCPVWPWNLMDDLEKQ